MIPHSFSFYYNYTTLKRHANDYLYYVCLIYLRVFNTYPIEKVLILLLRTPNTRNQESLDKVYHFCLISLFFFFTCFFFFFFMSIVSLAIGLIQAFFFTFFFSFYVNCNLAIRLFALLCLIISLFVCMMVEKR